MNDNAFDWYEFIRTNYIDNIDTIHTRASFLLQVLILTIRYPQVKLYLKNLLNHFAIDELENIFGGWSILHYMCKFPFNISLNAFEIIINYGINVNIKCNDNVAAHQLFHNQCNNHVNNILNLLIKYSVNLNIGNFFGETVLDVLVNKQVKLNKEAKNCATTIIDFGGITVNARINTAIHDFTQSYECSSTKPAIKNENKI